MTIQHELNLQSLKKLPKTYKFLNDNNRICVYMNDVITNIKNSYVAVNEMNDQQLKAFDFYHFRNYVLKEFMIFHDSQVKPDYQIVNFDLNKILIILFDCDNYIEISKNKTKSGNSMIIDFSDDIKNALNGVK